MTPQVGCIARDCNDMSRATGDRTVTSRTHVVLQCFIRLNTANFDGAVQTVPQTDGFLHRLFLVWRVHPANAQATSASDTTSAAIT